jgi:hypothetical protein
VLGGGVYASKKEDDNESCQIQKQAQSEYEEESRQEKEEVTLRSPEQLRGLA